MSELQLPPIRAPRPLNTDTEGVAITYPVSPTGAPRIPTSVAPYAATIVIVAGALSHFLPSDSIAYTAANVIVQIGAAFGILSAGHRKAGG